MHAGRPVQGATAAALTANVAAAAELVAEVRALLETSP
jgi:hypothetical protein